MLRNNLAVTQPQRQSPPVQQPQTMYNGQFQGNMNQHNLYSEGQIPPPQGLEAKWVNSYQQTGIRALYLTAQYSYLFSA